MTNTDVALGLALTMLVIGILGAWFYGCGRADREREVRAYAQNTLLYAGAGFAIGIAFLTTDLSPSQPEERMAFVALTVGSFLLLYAAVSAIVACDDNALAIVNLTGRALLLTDPQLAPFYTLPAPQAEPAASLPPVRPRTF